MFQFITITYQHEKFIIEHLESIKFQIETFGIKNALLTICDDCSTDRTIEFAESWIAQNYKMFAKVDIFVNQNNFGIVSNYLNAVKNIQYLNYKILSGDDLYYSNFIKSAQILADFVATPVIGFTKNGKYEFDTHYAFRRRTKKKISKRLKKESVFYAPGILMSKELIQNQGLVTHISRFTWIEDLPSWQYLFKQGKVDFTYQAISVPYIMYRSNVGIYGDSRSQSEKRKQFLLEEEEMRKYYQMSQNSRNPLIKYLNPKNYIDKVKRTLKIKSEQERIVLNDAKVYYLMIKNKADIFLSTIN